MATEHDIYIKEQFAAMRKRDEQLRVDIKELYTILTVGNGRPSVISQIAVNRNSLKGLAALCLLILAALVKIWLNQ